MSVQRFDYEEFDLSGVRTYPLASRRARRGPRFRARRSPGASVASFVDSLPNMLAAADFQGGRRAIVDARARGGGIVWGLGAHVIKTGLGRCSST